MTAKEMADIMGKECMVSMEKIQVRCTIHDCRSSFGRGEALIIPVEGEGQQWVSLERVQLIK